MGFPILVRCHLYIESPPRFTPFQRLRSRLFRWRWLVSLPRNTLWPMYINLLCSIDLKPSEQICTYTIMCITYIVHRTCIVNYGDYKSSAWSALYRYFVDAKCNIVGHFPNCTVLTKFHDRFIIFISWYLDYTSQRYPIVIDGGNIIYHSHSVPGIRSR